MPAELAVEFPVGIGVLAMGAKPKAVVAFFGEDVGDVFGARSKVQGGVDSKKTCRQKDEDWQEAISHTNLLASKLVKLNRILMQS